MTKKTRGRVSLKRIKEMGFKGLFCSFTKEPYIQLLIFYNSFELNLKQEKCNVSFHLREIRLPKHWTKLKHGDSHRKFNMTRNSL